MATNDGYDWTAAAAAGTQPPETNKLVVEGYHRLTIVRCYRSSKKHGDYTSKRGDPQVLIILADYLGREITMMLTLSEAAAWTIARLLSACDVDLDRLRDKGIVPDSFADQDVAERELCNLACWAHVTFNEKGWSEVTPLHADNVPESDRNAEQARKADKTAKPDDDDIDIPF